MRIESFAPSWDRLQPQFSERALQLLINELYTAMELGFLVGSHFQGTLEAVEDRQHRFERVGQSVFAELLLFPRSSFAGIFKFCLGASQTVQQGIALGSELRKRVSLHWLRFGG